MPRRSRDVDVAKNLKLPIVDLVSSYSQLSIAAQGTALEGKGVRDVFTAFAQAARVNRQSTDELKGSFLALTQIISKGMPPLIITSAKHQGIFSPKYNSRKDESLHQ